MKTQKIDLTRLRNDEHFQLNTEFRDLVNASNPQTLKIAAQYKTYLSLYTQEDEALKKTAMCSPLLSENGMWWLINTTISWHKGRVEAKRTLIKQMRINN